jgi:hypothetical protein
MGSSGEKGEGYEAYRFDFDRGAVRERARDTRVGAVTCRSTEYVVICDGPGIRYGYGGGHAIEAPPPSASPQVDERHECFQRRSRGEFVARADEGHDGTVVTSIITDVVNDPAWAVLINLAHGSRRLFGNLMQHCGRPGLIPAPPDNMSRQAVRLSESSRLTLHDAADYSSSGALSCPHRE